MFGLTQPQFNAVRARAKKLNEAVDKLTAKQKQDNEIMKAIICEHHSPISTIIEKMKFVWVAGYLAGRVGKRDNGDGLYD
ncbi:MAG: hypothetical protein HUJ97_00035 [Bacteroidales bacterium]|nr:hypothetical protein [Bacteroidales bacterium]